MGGPGRVASVELAFTVGDACDVVIFSLHLEAFVSFFDEKSLRKNPGLGFGATGSCGGGSIGTGGTTSTTFAAIVPAVPGLEGVRALLPPGVPGVPGGLAPGVLGRSKPGNTGNAHS